MNHEECFPTLYAFLGCISPNGLPDEPSEFDKFIEAFSVQSLYAFERSFAMIELAIDEMHRYGLSRNDKPISISVIHNAIGTMMDEAHDCVIPDMGLSNRA